MDRKMRKPSGGRIDWVIIVCIVALVLYGLIAIAAATADPVDADASTAEKLEALDWSLVTRQAIWFGVGIVAVVVIMLIDYARLKDLAALIFGANVALLALLFALATVTKSTVSWYRFGSIGFQPSELCKISLILVLARYFGNRPADSRLQTVRDIAPPVILTAIAFILVALQPDLGTAMVFVAIALGMTFAARITWKPVAIMGGALALAAPVVWMLLAEHQKNRILVFFNPSYDTSNAGYNVRYSKIAIGSGQLAGKGMFNDGGLSQLNWVPEKETDFIFSVTAESFGFLGGMVLLLLYAILVIRTLLIAIRTRDRFGAFICVGVATMVAFHVFENIGMTMGIMPVAGIPLPFMSYGGSSMLTNMIAFGLVLNVSLRGRRRRGTA